VDKTRFGRDIALRCRTPQRGVPTSGNGWPTLKLAGCRAGWLWLKCAVRMKKQNSISHEKQPNQRAGFNWTRTWYGFNAKNTDAWPIRMRPANG